MFLSTNFSKFVECVEKKQKQKICRQMQKNSFFPVHLHKIKKKHRHPPPIIKLEKIGHDNISILLLKTIPCNAWIFVVRNCAMMIGK